MSAKSFNYQRSVNFTWQRTDGEEVLEKHRQALIETAQAQIEEGLKAGEACGELFDNIRMGAEDGEDGIEYHGKWMLEKESTIEKDDVFIQ